MAIKKSELYSKIWKSCDELRGGMDASQYKDYVLILLFMKYVTDKYYGKKNALIEVPEGASYHDMAKLKGNKKIGDKINTIIHELAEVNELVGVITVADFNDENKLGKGKEMVDRLTNLIAIFEDEKLDFSSNRVEGDDLLGDAYEYLMRHFASEAGKDKGQFYTPAEVSRVMAKLIGINEATLPSETIYDPTCGSGSLLLKAAAETKNGITIYGQEKDNSTAALAKINMILHGNEIADIKQGNTLSNSLFKDGQDLKKFDFGVANPPFSYKAWKSGFDAADDDRFDGYGTPPAKNGDYTFLLHFIYSLKSHKGKGAIILPHGVLFRGNVEAKIRQTIIEKGFIKGIIGLPSNLFYGTGIPACILVIDKENAHSRKGIFMINASKGFVKDGNKNRLREQDIHKIVDIFNNKIEIDGYSRMIPLEEIEKNEFNLNITRYIEQQEEEERQDIEAHLMGGISNRELDELNKYWEAYPILRKELFSESSRAGYSELKINRDKIKESIFSNPEFISYTEEVESMLGEWKRRHTPMLKGIKSDSAPKEIIRDLAEDILSIFSDKNLIDKYDIYQYLMSYWVEIMKDDVYMIIEDGWVANEELIAKELVINHYFPEEKEKIDRLEGIREEKTNQREEFEEEHSGEEGFLEELKGSRGVSKTSVQERLMTFKKEIIPESNYLSDELKKKAKSITKTTFYKVEWEKGIIDEGDIFAELDIIHEYLCLYEEEAESKKEIKESVAELDNKVELKYQELSKEEIKQLIVNDKWMKSIIEKIMNELEQISYRLSSRIKELALRYENKLDELEGEVKQLTAKVEGHLQRMGFEW